MSRRAQQQQAGITDPTKRIRSIDRSFCKIYSQKDRMCMSCMEGCIGLLDEMLLHCHHKMNADYRKVQVCLASG